MGPNKHILIIDDHDGLRKGLASLLKATGYAVASAANGREALDYLRWADLPFAILVDLNMPVMDGRQFCQECGTTLRSPPSR